MASMPGEMPDFDFQLEPSQYYDHIELADKVLWPMVDAFWRRDWRRYSAISDDISLRRAGVFAGRSLDILLEANNDLLEDDEESDGSTPVISTVSIGIEEEVTDERRDIILLKAEPTLDAEVPEGAKVKVSTSYSIDTDGDLAIEGCQAIDDIVGTNIWFRESRDEIDEAFGRTGNDSEEASDDDDISIKIHEYDLERLTWGIYVLSPTRAIEKALKKIRANPIL